MSTLEAGAPTGPVQPAQARGLALGAGRPGWILKRALFGLLTLWLVATLVFVATQALPSDPAQAILGRATPAQLEALRVELGLDQPLFQQYTEWLSGVLQGDLGTSLATREPVGDLLGPAFVNSMILLLIAGGIAIPGGIVLGFMAAVRRERRFDRALMGTSVLFTALPEFVVGLTLVILFSTTVFELLPAVTTIAPGASALSEPEQLILPVATLVLAAFPYIFRLSRAAMIEVLASDYVTMARLKGMPERRVVWRHAARNALVAPVQASAVILSYLLGGVVVIEIVFAYPGLGTALTDAVSVRDLPTIQGVVLVFATGVVLFNTVADLLTVALTPRLRASR